MSGFKYVYSDINPSTLTGAIDVIVIEQPDGTFKCGPFHVRFGKMGTLKPADKIVDIHLNGKFLDHLHMKLGSAGEAYFVESVTKDQNDQFDISLAVSPIQSDNEDARDDADLSQRALSAEHLNGDLNCSRNNSKKRFRRGNRTKTEESTDICESEMCVSDEDFIRDGYNSDGVVDQMNIDDLHDHNMTWDWGNFPLDNNPPVTEKKSNGKDAYLEDIMKSEELKREYIYTSSTRTWDAGYKSDGESPILAMSPSHPSIHDLRLSLCGDLTSNTISDEKFFHYLVSFEDFMKDPNEILKNNHLVVLLNGHYYNWAVAAPILVSILAFRSELPPTIVDHLKSTHMPEKRRKSAWFSWRQKEPTAVNDVPPTLEPKTTDSTVESSKVYVKKIRLSSSEIIDLHLKPGRNDVTFSMTTKYQGTTCAYAAIYLWQWYDKIVISDVDGTITKSDVLGHVLPILGRDWTQSKVVRLYKKIQANNYRFIYLSARAIGQSSRTRSFLQDVIQDTSEKLPDGPILLSPTSLLQSLHREVIEKKPELFKIQCLNDVRSLFPDEVMPLYAGFGNKVNDVIAYKTVGIDLRRIFTVNHEGTLKNEYCQKWSTSYGNLSDLVDYFFQFHAIPNSVNFNDTIADFSDVNYWYSPIDETEIRKEINQIKKG